MSPYLVPLFAIGFTFGSIVAIVALSLKFRARKIEHEEVMKAMELGQQLPTLEVRHRYNYLSDLRTGIISLGAGLGIMVFFSKDNGNYEGIANIGAIPAFIGLGLIVMALVVKSIGDKENGNPAK